MLTPVGNVKNLNAASVPVHISGCSIPRNQEYIMCTVVSKVCASVYHTG